MKVLLNNSKRTYQYGVGEDTINFPAGSKMEFEDEVADCFLKSPEIELVSDDTALKEKDAEIAKLKAEAEAAKKANAKAEAAKKEVK